MQPDECTPEVTWEVRWKNKVNGDLSVFQRRSQSVAVELATKQRAAGFDTKLFRIEKTETDF